MKLVNIRDLKSLGFGLVGSSPTRGTILKHIDRDLSTGRARPRPLKVKDTKVRVFRSVFQYGNEVWRYGAVGEARQTVNLFLRVSWFESSYLHQTIYRGEGLVTSEVS